MAWSWRRLGELGEEVAEERGLGATNLPGGRRLDAMERAADESPPGTCRQGRASPRVGFRPEHGEDAIEQPASFPLPPNLRL